MKILAIETSCDETCAAVTEGTKILSNVVWSQIDLHKEFGGVVPSVAKRAHEEKIDFIVNQAIEKSGVKKDEIDAVAVTAGPGLAIALEVGIKKAKELAKSLNKPLLAINHIEGHVLSPLAGDFPSSADPADQLRKGKPAFALVVSGGHTELILVKKIGEYEIVARTIDDALGEALDKTARSLGLGYPGGAELEKKAKDGDPKSYPLPRPMAGREDRGEYSYSGLKTAFFRLVSRLTEESADSQLDEKTVNNLAAAFQNRAFEHLIRITEKRILEYKNIGIIVNDLLVGGGVAANTELRKRIETEIEKKFGVRVWFPGKGLYGDNAGMIGIAAGFKAERDEYSEIESVDRIPRAQIDKPLVREN